MSAPTPSEVLTRALHLGYDESGWHPALREALEGVGAEQAAWKPSPERNSIFDIVRHLIHWKKAALDDFRSLGSREAFGAYSARDWQPVPETAVWEEDVAELWRLSSRLIETLPASAKDPAPPHLWRLLNLATHDAYHAGQIVYLRRLYDER